MQKKLTLFVRISRKYYDMDTKNTLGKRNVIFISIFANKMTRKNGKTAPLCMDA